MELIAIDQAGSPPGDHFSAAEIQAMQRAVINLFGKWDITDAQAVVLLGDISARTYQRWKQGQLGRVQIDLASRLSNLIGIHKALRLLYSEPQRGYDWIRAPNAAFGGDSPLQVMLGGQLTALMRVRRYLDSYRSPW